MTKGRRNGCVSIVFTFNWSGLESVDITYACDLTMPKPSAPFVLFSLNSQLDIPPQYQSVDVTIPTPSEEWRYDPGPAVILPIPKRQHWNTMKQMFTNGDGRPPRVPWNRPYAAKKKAAPVNSGLGGGSNTSHTQDFKRLARRIGKVYHKAAK